MKKSKSLFIEDSRYGKKSGKKITLYLIRKEEVL